MNGVHCQTSAMITDVRDHQLSDSQGTGSMPIFFSVRFRIPTDG